MNKKTLKGFTLVELLVAMAIIGVLLGLTLFGISAAQRNARDTARKAALQDINAGFQDYYTKQGAYPNFVVFNTDNTIKLTYKVNSTCPGVECVVVPLEGPANPSSLLEGVGKTTPTTNANATKASYYCYDTQSDGYSLSVLLENEVKFDLGSSSTSPGCDLPTATTP